MVEPAEQLSSVSQTGKVRLEPLVSFERFGRLKTKLLAPTTKARLEFLESFARFEHLETELVAATTKVRLEPLESFERFERLKTELVSPTKSFHILIFGVTGVGKSTFLNAITRDLEFRPDVISDVPGVGKSTFPKVVLNNAIKRDLVKPGTPTDDDSTCSSPATACNTQHLCNMLKYWKHEIDPTLAFLWEEELPRSVYHKDMLLNSPRANQILLSGVNGSDRGNNSVQVLKMEHSALQGPNSQWNLEVKYKGRENKASAKRWVNIWNFYPDAKVELKRNEIQLIISSPNEDHEFAVFGTPGTEDKKRMQMGIFGGKPKQGKHWQIFVTLFDDTMMAFKRVCEREKGKGRQLLTTLAGLLVSNSDEDIKIDITALEDGWKIIGSHIMTIKSKEAWNSPENSTDFPCCVFEISHVDKTKQTFFCGIQASHLNDTAETELLALFEHEQENEEHLNSQNFIPPPELTTTEDNFIEVLEKALARVYELDKLGDAIRNSWESLGRALALEPLVPRERFKEPKTSFTDDLLLHLEQEQTEAFVSFLMLVLFVGCLTGTRFVTPHLLKVNMGKLKVASC